jgi:hypothetical protein
VLRAYLTDAKRCYIHAHRTVQTQCARCKTPYCDECLTERTDGIFADIVAKDERQPDPLFCARCVEELEALGELEAFRHRPWWQRIRPGRATLNRAAIYLVVAAAILVPIGFAARSAASTTLSPEELARVKVGLTGSFQSVEGTNFLSTVYGGTFVRANAPAAPGHDGSRLIDTWIIPDVPGWRSQSASFPQELVFQLPEALKMNKVILRPQPDEPPETWVKDFEVLVSSKSATDGFTSATRGSLSVEQARRAIDPDGADQPRFEFAETGAKWVMLRILSNQGSRDYTSLGEFEVYWQKK